MKHFLALLLAACLLALPLTEARSVGGGEKALARSKRQYWGVAPALGVGFVPGYPAPYGGYGPQYSWWWRNPYY